VRAYALVGDRVVGCFARRSRVRRSDPPKRRTRIGMRGLQLLIERVVDDPEKNCESELRI